jgi:epoxyqueuosine reductase
MGALEQSLLARAHELGFALAGIAPAAEADGFERLREWLDRGFAGEMGYMRRHAEARRHPRSIYPPVRSVVMVAMSYAPSRVEEGQSRVAGAEALRSPGGAPHRGVEDSAPATRAATARVARYAQGADYHQVVRERLRRLGAWLRERRPGCWGRAVVDTAPLLERDFARRAGLGWIGKNTMLLNPRLGSWFVLGALLVDLDLDPTPPFEAGHCGTCTACLDACPTGAFAGPYQLDARRCISYLTIELKGDVPEAQRPAVGDWLFGCDVCQEVCPWNHKALPGHPALAPRGDLALVDAAELLGLSAEAFRARFEGTALYPRPGRPGVLRNAALVLGNTGDAGALPALRRALDDAEPAVREAAAWAIARIQERGMATKTTKRHEK